MAFDPYYRWLGIPPKDQPPNHYRLLGIEPFECDPDVISNGADRQMVHIRSFQSGKHGDVCQAILNEIAAARVCLLDPAGKDKYDQDLKYDLTPRPLPPPLISKLKVQEERGRAARHAVDHRESEDDEKGGLHTIASWLNQDQALPAVARYVLATIVCITILVAFFGITAALGWQRGGGAIPILILLATLAFVWRVLTGMRVI